MSEKLKKGIIYCIHGNSSSSKIFEFLINAKTLKHEVIAVDLPGHANNQENWKEKDFTIKSFRDFLIENINSLNSEILLVGNSLGGHLAIEIANEINNLKGLVIMGTPPIKKPINFEEAWMPSKNLNTFFEENPTNEEISSASLYALFNKNLKEVIVTDFKKTNPLVRKVIANEIAQDELKNEFEIFIKLNIPKYIIAGKQDPTLNRKYLEECKNKAENFCEIINIVNCGHYPIDSPDEFVKIIKKITEEISLN